MSELMSKEKFIKEPRSLCIKIGVILVKVLQKKMTRWLKRL